MVFPFTDLLEVTQSPMPSASHHEGKLNYSVHFHTPHGDSSEPLFGDSVSQASPKRRQSTPLKASTSKPEKALPTPKQQKNVPAAAATPRAATSTSSVSRIPKDDDSSDVAKPIPLSTFYGKSPSSNVSRPLVPPDSQAASRRPPNFTTSEIKEEEADKLERPNICVGAILREIWSTVIKEVEISQDLQGGVEEKVYLALQDIREEWERQGTQTENLKKEIMSLRTEVGKTTCLPVEVRKVSNDVKGPVEYVNTFGVDFVELRANMLGVQQDVQSTKGDIESVRKDCHNLKGDTHGIRGATEIIKSRYLALSLEHQTILGEVKTSREDVQQVSINLHGVKSQLENVAGDVRTMKVDLATVQKDVFALKGDVGCIRHEVAALQATGSHIEEGIASLKNIIQPFPVVNIPVDEIKSDSDEVPGTPQKATPRSHSSKCAEAASTQTSFQNSDELNTSEVTFKARQGEKYGPKLFDDRPAPDSIDTQADTQETQDPTSVMLPQHFVPCTEQDSSRWPSADSAGDIGLHDFMEAGPSDSQPGYITVVGMRIGEDQYEKVGYLKTVDVSPPEAEEPKTPSSGKQSVKSRAKSGEKKK